MTTSYFRAVGIGSGRCSGGASRRIRADYHKRHKVSANDKMPIGQLRNLRHLQRNLTVFPFQFHFHRPACFCREFRVKVITVLAL